jgi:hypothetical protein
MREAFAKLLTTTHKGNKDTNHIRKMVRRAITTKGGK